MYGNFLLCDPHPACLLAFEGNLHAILSMSWLQKVHSRSGKQVHNIYHMQEAGTGGNGDSSRYWLCWCRV